MRKIKFRVWDKKLMKMLVVKEIDFEYKIAILKVSDLSIAKRTFDEIELMQFTGLFDKNGVEIYEGDIVVDNFGPQIQMVVKWDDAGFRTFGKYDGKNYVGYVGHTNICGNNTCMVIGNIYENKELLNE